MTVSYTVYVGPYLKIELPEDFDWDVLHELNDDNGGKFYINDGNSFGGLENTAYLYPFRNTKWNERQALFDADSFSPPIECGLDFVRTELMDFVREFSKQIGVFRQSFSEQLTVKWGILNRYE